MGLGVEDLEVFDVKGEPLASRLGIQVGLSDKLGCLLFSLGDKRRRFAEIGDRVGVFVGLLEVAPIGSLQDNRQSIGIIARVTAECG